MYLKRLWLLVLLVLVSVSFVSAQNGSEEQGTIDADNPEFVFPLELAEGDTVTLSVEAISDDLDPYLELLDEAGDTVDENDDIDTDAGDYNSRIIYTADFAGAYTIRVTGAGETTGDFLLTIAFGEPTIAEGGEIDYGEDYRPELDLTAETEHFIIHYTEEGEDAAPSDYVAAAVEIVERVWQAEIVEFGWYAPPTDGTAGGDERFDLYLINLCSEDEAKYGSAQGVGVDGDNPNSPEVELRANPSFLMVDNDFNDDCFTGGTGDLLTTVAHEFNHNIQFGYDGSEAHSWFYEATATWMEPQVAGEEQQATIYVGDVFQTPEICFGNFDASYGTYLFIQSLVDAHGEQIVLELWDNIAQVDGFEALQMTLEPYGDDIPTAVARYKLQNLVRAYPLADQFGVTVYLENTIDAVGDWAFTGDGIQELGASYFAVTLAAARYSAYVSGDDSSELSLYAIGIYDGGADVSLLDSNTVFTSDGYDHVYLMVFDTAYDDNVDECQFLTNYQITVEVSEDEIADVIDTLDVSNFEPLGN